MSLVSLQNLETLLQEFLEGLKKHSLHQDYALFHTLYTYGFRIRELQNCQTWTRVGNNLINCQTSKRSNDRLIDATKAHPLLLDSVDCNKNFIYISSYSTYRRIFEGKIRGGGFCVGDKKLSTHVFRHYVVKKLHEAGQSYAQIQDYLGLTSLVMTMNYVHSNIQYYCPSPMQQ